ncbi:MAG: glycosyltransferase [Bacteroidales bacterium]|nr:glycosyltransferase [Bacteroidales bacterium]
MQPLVSVICATYRHKDFIGRCLEGILTQQTDFDFEVLVNDDASTDGTVEIIKDYEARFPHRLRVVYQTENQYSKGVEISLGILYPMARGKYIAECEGDDYWTDCDKLQKQVDYMEAHPDCPMCYMRAAVYDQRREEFYHSQMGSPYQGYEALLLNNPVPTMTCLFRRDILQDYIRDIRPLEHHWATADYPKWLYFAHRAPLVFLDVCTGVYRDKSPASISNPRQYATRLKFLQSIYDIRCFYADLYGFADKLSAQILYEHERYCIKEGIHYHDYPGALRELKNATSPTRWDRLIFYIRIFWGTLFS